MRPHQLSSLTPFIAIAMVLGLLTGAYFGPAAIPLGAFGKIYIQLIKAIAIPLVLFTIIESIIGTELSWKTASRWLIIVGINAFFALVIGLSLSNIVKPGVGFSADGTPFAGQSVAAPKEFSAVEFITSAVPESIIQPFAENNVLAVVLIALLVGIAIRSYLHSPGAEVSLHSAQRLCHAVNGVINTILVWLIALVPLAVFCVTARTVGEYGFAPFTALAWYVCLGCLGLALQIVLIYPLWVRFVGGIPLGEFFRAAQRPIACAFGTNSSLATLPVTLRALDDLKVPKAASRLGACIGTNFNNDGILLYEAMAVLFVAQAAGVHFSLGEQVFIAVISLAAAIGVAGVPEAGIVSLSLVLTAAGLPLEILPLLLSVDWIVARMRSVTNVMSDMTVSVAVAGLTKGQHRPGA